MHLRPLAAVLLLAAAAVACAPADEEDAGSAETVEPTSSDSSAEGSPAVDACSPTTLPLHEDGVLTVGTDSPAFEPWFVDDDPTNGKGFESAVAYAVAEELGFTRDQVEWVTVRFNASYRPGPKDFDFDINQISITDEREEVVDFSEGYYTQSQAAIALADSPAADATAVADLADLRLGAQTGTTSLSVIRESIRPTTDPLVFPDTNAAKQALLNGQVDAILADFYTANFITAVEIPEASIVGQFESPSGEEEQFGLLFEQDSGLVACVDEALATLREDGTLAELEDRWLSSAVDVPVLE